MADSVRRPLPCPEIVLPIYLTAGKICLPIYLRQPEAGSAESGNYGSEASVPYLQVFAL
jgi:hypothetical protein